MKRFFVNAMMMPRNMRREMRGGMFFCASVSRGNVRP